MSKPKGSVIEQLKAEITAQSEGQVEIIEFSFQGIKFDKFTPEISGLFGKYPKLISLEFSQSDLKTLDGFPKLPGLFKLCLEENQLDDSVITYISENLKHLQFLSLSNNKITKVETLKALAKLPELIQLDLQENSVAEEKNYRETLFQHCMKLEILDNKDKDGVEVTYSDDDEDDVDDGDDELLDDGVTDDDEEFDEEDDEDEEEEPKKKAKK